MLRELCAGDESTTSVQLRTSTMTPPTPPLNRQFWGMAFQKLHVFNLTRFRKVLWMDSDTLVLKNLDHLLGEPSFTGACAGYSCRRTRG